MRQHVVILSALLVGLWGLAPQAAHAAGSVPNTALILGTSVTPGTNTDHIGPKSLEQQQAEADGFVVTIVTAAQWGAMMAADFAKYQVIIIGDPNCQGLGGFAAAQANATVWEPVVMASGGNKVLIGTDATLHNTGPGGTQRGDLLEKGGIGFAGAIAGATGAYVDTSCSYSDSVDPFTSAPPGTPVPIMDGLSTHGALQFTAGGAPCTGTISIVASTGPTSGLHDADLSNWSCSVHAFFDKFPSDWTVLALATDSSVPKVYAANDVDTGALVSGAPYILVSGVGVSVSSSIALTPATATDCVGTSHTVTATVMLGTTPLVGQTVTFFIDSGPNLGRTGTGVTNASGQTTFTYTDTGGAGTDSISATFVLGGVLEKATASKTWNICEQPITASGTTFNAVEGQPFSATVATITDPTPASTSSEYTATIDWGDLSPTSAGTVSGFPGPFTVTGSHTYAEERTYTVKVHITDTDSTNAADATSTAIVADAALTASPACLTNSQQSYNGPTATFTDAASPFGTLSDFTATINWQDGFSSPADGQPVMISGPIFGVYTVTGIHTYATTGNHTITTTITDVGGSRTSTSCNTLAFSFAPGGGSFVIGDKNPALQSKGGVVTFWGAQWAKDNPLSVGSAPRSFKGFAENPTTPTCGGMVAGWSADPGNSTPPPDGPLPAFMAVIVTSSADKAGSTISGNIVHIVIVKTNPGYEPNPGHAGTGTVVAVVC